MLYITWNEIVVNPNKKIHPNTEDYYVTNWEWVFNETKYTDWNGLYIWLLDNPTIPTLSFNFQIVEKTEAEVNALLLQWYWVDWESNPYVTVSNYVFTDNRPQLPY